MIITTERLILRPWCDTDLEPFAQLNADPRVMEYFPSTLAPEESTQLARRMQAKIEEQGWGFWAVSVAGIAEFVGFIGLNKVEKETFPVHFAPAVEVGWRIAYDFWNRGYATEGAKACLRFGFENLALDEIVSFTSVNNLRSRAVMEKIGMHRNPADDFDHPKVPEGNILRRHVLYRLSKSAWQMGQNSIVRSQKII